MFQSGKQDKGTLIEELHNRIKNGDKGALTDGLTEIENRRQEIDEKLYSLAKKHRETYKT